METGREPPTIDIGEGIRRGKMELKVSDRESEAEEAARIARENADAHHQRVRDDVLFGVTILGIVGGAVFCAYVLISTRFGPDEKKWAMTVLASIITGVVTYTLGKNRSAGTK